MKNRKMLRLYFLRRRYSQRLHVEVERNLGRSLIRETAGSNRVRSRNYRARHRPASRMGAERDRGLGRCECECADERKSAVHNEYGFLTRSRYLPRA